MLYKRLRQLGTHQRNSPKSWLNPAQARATNLNSKSSTRRRQNEWKRHLLNPRCPTDKLTRRPPSDITRQGPPMWSTHRSRRPPLQRLSMLLWPPSSQIKIKVLMALFCNRVSDPTANRNRKSQGSPMGTTPPTSDRRDPYQGQVWTAGLTCPTCLTTKSMMPCHPSSGSSPSTGHPCPKGLKLKIYLPRLFTKMAQSKHHKNQGNLPCLKLSLRMTKLAAVKTQKRPLL